MSRARSIEFQGTRHWFDVHRKNEPASVAHLELLSAAENLEIDDLLDEGLTQGEIILRLRETLGQGVIPADVLERQRARKIEASKPVECRLCSMDGRACEGRITRHHFISRWLMRELSNYEAYAARSKCCIPICMGRHRDLHMRNEGDKSIWRYLTREERLFAHKMLTELREEHEKIFDLLAGGEGDVSYEAQLIRDYQASNFIREEADLTFERKSVSYVVQGQ